MIIYDGQVLWHDLDERLCAGLYEVIRIHEMKHLRSTLVSEVISRISKYDTLDDLLIQHAEDSSTSTADRVDILWLRQQRQQHGFISSGWKALNLESSSSIINDPSTADGDNLSIPADDDFLAQLTYSPHAIICPRLYATSGSQGSDDVYGRCLIYRQGKFMLTFLLEHFSDLDGPDFMKDLDSDLLSMSGSPISPLSQSSESLSIAEQRFLGLCANMQRGLSSELEHFDKSLRQPSSSVKNLNHTELNDKPASQSMNYPHRQQALNNSWNHLPKYSRVIYHNETLRSMRLSTWCAHTIDPLLLWPTLLINPYSSIKQYQQSSMNIVASKLIELAYEARGRYVLSAGLMSASIEPHMIKSLNHVHNQLASNRAREVCIRIRSGNRGGVWMYGRRMNDRYLYIVVERCDTMNEMQELVQQIIQTNFQHILI
jgi:hypothetical protein